MIAALTHAVMESGSNAPMIGAGAVAGLLGAYLMLHPVVKVLVLVFSRIPIRMPHSLFCWVGCWFRFTV